MLRIGIDYRFAITTHRGIGTYIREIVNELTIKDKENKYFLYVNKPITFELPENFHIRILPYSNILLFEQLFLPLQARRDKLNIIWYPSNSGPLFLHRSIRLLVTVHDMISFLHYNAVRKFSYAAIKYRLGEYYRRYALELGADRIDQVLTVSDYSASEIVKVLKRRAIVIPNHISLGNNASDDTILKRLNITPGNYLFSMTGTAPHKNLNGLIEIFSDPTVSAKLVISGVPSDGISTSYPEEIRRKVIFTGYITEAEKSALYKNASAFLFLSFYEGFGIPLLEAMQFNLPIIASRSSSVPEILGEGGILVDPENVKEIKELICEVSKPDYDRSKWKKGQSKQLYEFSSWQRSADKFLQVAIELISSP